jgi:hypothetical protein
LNSRQNLDPAHAGIRGKNLAVGVTIFHEDGRKILAKFLDRLYQDRVGRRYADLDLPAFQCRAESGNAAFSIVAGANIVHQFLILIQARDDFGRRGHGTSGRARNACGDEEGALH